MPPPTNTSAATATVIASLPASITQDVNDAGTTYTVWYRYTATAADTVIGFFAFGDLVDYSARLYVWLDPGGAGEENYLSLTALNRPIQLPVTAGFTYYLEISSHFGDVTPAVLTLIGTPTPCEDAPAGSILINDDTTGFPAAIISAGDGQVLQFRRPFPAGEQGTALPDGTLVVNDVSAQNFKIYNGALEQQTTVNMIGTGLLLASSNQADTFYFGRRTSGTVTTAATDGSLGALTWTLPGLSGGLRGIVSSRDETVLYYADMSFGAAVKRWDVVNDVALSDLAAGVAGYNVNQDLLVLADETILIGYRKITAPTDFFVRHYAPDGTTLHTYAFGTVTLNRLQMALEEPLAFWVWLFSATPGLSIFQKIQISDGAILVNFTAERFEGGVYTPAMTATPALFGHDNSCPFIILRQPLPCPDEPGGPEPPEVAPPYSLNTRYIRRQRRAPHIAQENARVVYRKFELDLERGQGLATGQGSDPIVLLRLSRDGGQTWGEEIQLHAGALGAYTQRVLARRLGHSRDTVFEVTVSDPIAWSLVGAWLDLEPGTS